MGQTLFHKVWDAHQVRPADEHGEAILYVDLHLVHEVTSPQAFDGLRMLGRRVRRPDRTLATVDHNVPTIGREAGITDPLSAAQVAALERNCAEFGIPLFSLRSSRQGIVHVIGPEMGVTQPGMTIVCGDSHTSTHGAFGALAFGIGTSEVEHVLATQTLTQAPPRTMRINIEGETGLGVGAKDLILGTIGQIGVAGAQGYVIEYAGAAIRALSMEGRMTVCNMSIEGGGRAGMIAPDDTTFAWIEGRPGAPADFAAAVEAWRELPSDWDAFFDAEVHVDASTLAPQVTLGHQPRHGRPGDRPGARPPTTTTTRPTATGSGGRWSTWGWTAGRPSRTSPSTRSSSARAPTGACRTCGRRRRWCAASASPPACGRWSCPARCR